MSSNSVPDYLRELYDAAKGVEGTGLWIPHAADRAIELIDRIARLESDLRTIKSAVRLMVPEPQQSGLVKMIDAALKEPSDGETQRG